MKNCCIGVLAHVDAGKTTLSEQLLYLGGTIRHCGRVDHADACLDFTDVERRRGITVFSAQAEFCHGRNRYFLVDTPGHADFSPEMERSLSVLDYAVLVISCVDGIQAHTETLWRLLRERGLPVFCFLNKADCPGADPELVLRQLHDRFGGGFCAFSDGLTESVREQIALTDDESLALYLDGALDEPSCWEAAARAVKRRALFPVFVGSALSGSGVEALMDGLDRICRTAYDLDGPTEASVYQVRHDRQGNRVAFCKVCSGVLRPKQAVGEEKVHELRRYTGGRWTPMEQAEAGTLTAVTGLRTIRPGGRIGGEQVGQEKGVLPFLLAQVQAENVPPARLLEIFRLLEDEEPTLSVQWNEVLRQMQVAVMGEIQLEILQQTVLERFGISVAFGPCQVAFQETIAAPVRGCGHYEPLRHYAEVHLLLEPGPRGSGVKADSRCATDCLPLHWQRLIETHILEKTHAGALAGMPLTDVRVSLLAGRAHEKHTEGGDFRQATYRAIRQALFCAENVLLEPYYRFTAEAEPSIAGKILSDLPMLHGTFEPPEISGGVTRIHGRCPVSTMLAYSRGFAAMTRGRGSLRLEYDGYEPCYNMQEVVSRIGYDRERDTEHPADSIFCAHGAGFPVKWYDAPARMHLKLD